MTISEPMTLVTDAVLAGASLWFALRLARLARRTRQRSIALWSAAFMSGGAAALLGGIYHGFGPGLGALTSVILWKGTVWLAGVSSLTSLSGSLTAVLAASPRAPLVGIVWAKFAVYAIWMAGRDEFRYVVYDQLTGMAAILLLHAYDIYSRKDPAGRFMMAAVLASVAGAALQQSGFDLHRNFNHNDLFHVVQIGANYLFYRGTLRLSDRDQAPAAAPGTTR